MKYNQMKLSSSSLLTGNNNNNISWELKNSNRTGQVVKCAGFDLSDVM